MNAASSRKPNTLSIEVDKDLLARVIWRHFQDGAGPMTADEAVAAALARFVAPTDRPASAQEPAPAVVEPEGPGYIWVSEGKQLTLPEKTIVQMYYKAFYYQATVLGGSLMFHGTMMNPAQFARHVGGSGRNAKHALKVKRSHDLDFIPARLLFTQEGVDVPIDTLELPKPDIFYRDVLPDLDKMDSLNFPDKLFRKIHHAGSGLFAFRRYVEQGANTGKDGSKCKQDSANGGNVLRMRFILEKYAGESTDEQWMVLVSAAIREHPRTSPRL